MALKTHTICCMIPSLGSGGMERVMSELLVFFSTKENLTIHLLLYGKNRATFFHVPQCIIIHKPKLKFNDSIRVFSTLSTLLFIRKTIKEIKPTSILNFGEYWNSFILISLAWIRIPIYISDRCQPDKKLVGFHEKLRKKLYPYAKGIIAQTDIAKNIYTGLYLNKNIKTIGNPIKDISIDNKAIKENIILTVGRLIESKNHELLIEIFNEISTSNWKLIIIGGDALKQKMLDKLTNTIKNSKIEDRVILTGNIQNVDYYYNRSKIFAFTSSSEGFPNVIGEAQSFGLPVVAFDCIAGPADLIKDNVNGFLVPLFDKELFKKRLLDLMENEILRCRLGEQAKNDIKQFSKEVICEEYYNFIIPEK